MKHIYASGKRALTHCSVQKMPCCKRRLSLPENPGKSTQLDSALLLLHAITTFLSVAKNTLPALGSKGSLQDRNVFLTTK